MTILTSQMSLLLLLLLSLTTFHRSVSSNDQKLVQCNEKDEETLLIFKKGINDSYGKISTWSTEIDCCAWEGVHCDNITGRVTELDLGNHGLTGEINLSILQLEFLSYLDLSLNHFDVMNIPATQHNITHPSNLIYLDLSTDSIYASLHMNNLDWLSPLSSLKYLNLSFIDLHKVTNWLQAVNTLPSLLELQLSDCKLNNFIINPSIQYSNLSSLLTLDLSYNNLTSQIPNWFFNLTRDLAYLDLSGNHIHGEIPSSLLNLQNLRYLDLSFNKLQGSIPDEISQLPNIQHLGLYRNMLSGSNIPSTLENLSSLNYLSIGGNNFSGEISENTFSKLSNLDSLDLSSSNFVFQFDLDWVPPFQLHELYLGNTNQGPNFPSWIYTQKSLQYLDLSSSGISLVDRNNFSSLIERISDYLDLSNNFLTGDISNLTLKGDTLYLSNNSFTGGLPNISPNAGVVDFSYNSFSGSIPHSWNNMKELIIINLWSNKLSGEVLLPFSDLKQLHNLNLGKNKLSGTIPINMSQKLQVVILRDNLFEGTIPPQLFNLPDLFHLDLAQNKLLGSIPDCAYNLTQMVASNNVNSFYADVTYELFTKGQDYMYRINPRRRTIDLSANNLSGNVPLELFHLVQVQTLNLSQNNFIGTISKMIGGMNNMESLDLSNNKFCGEIPQSMSLLTFLEYLNLSCNNFDGKIPIGTQLQSFNASSYIGNPKLCGAPLNNCTIKEENPKNATPSPENEDDDSIRESVFLGMGVGFAAGFWGICGSLFLIRKWRHACYRFVDGVGGKVYVTLMVKLNSFHRN
ncbi:receptor-like protein EIX1 isoform X1 [Trifolium pratense]|uniref:receptor-like protein EIX1 isoform X1 n=1 Tax=Trifolium pratense TaxID=57577 RepID=UPI001E69678D|nr:receptor-like protein EIX1 isoform X1 [Trifolium pratense]